MSELTLDEIKHIAMLAKLEFDDEGLKKIGKEFNDILGYVENIKEVDTTGIEFEHNLSDYNSSILQEDEVKPSLPRDKAVQNSTNGREKAGYIKTSRVVNKDE